MAEEKPKATRRRKTVAANQEAQNQIITLKLNKYQSIVEALGSWSTTLRIIFTVFLLGMLLFCGIAFITLAIKRLYPYSDITTNGLGATTIKSEKNEVSYWMLNTAILWADSGIQVEKGDIITIRSSGKSHTAIHHMYQAATGNTVNPDKWVGAEGEYDQQDTPDWFRRQFRIFPNMPSGALLMQVATAETKRDTPLEIPKLAHKKEVKDNFYFIGKERQNIYINNPGTLHFAVNDIVLDPLTILRMMSECLGEDEAKDDKNKIDNLIDGYKKENLEAIKDSAINVFNAKYKNTDQVVGRHMKMGLSRDGQPELSYYLEKSYKNAWYDDNVGSFLIMVEKIN